MLTFDNLGEATELERGSWPADAPLGHHRSVTVALPRLLEELDAHELTATFFVEAINCELYPEALLEIARRGHELGHHGWRHETWAELSVERERARRARRSYASRGGQLTLVLHPFLILEESWFAGVRELFRLIAAMARDGRTWVVSGERFAAWMEAA